MRLPGPENMKKAVTAETMYLLYHPRTIYAILPPKCKSQKSLNHTAVPADPLTTTEKGNSRFRKGTTEPPHCQP